MEIKKIGFLLMILTVLFSGGIFMEVEKAEACVCKVGSVCAGGCITSEALCNFSCSSTSGAHACSAGSYNLANHSVCLIGPQASRYCVGNSGCTTAFSYKYCVEDFCGVYEAGVSVWKTWNDDSVNGENCEVTTVGKDNCDGSNTYVGKWDHSEGKCVQCNPSNHKEIGNCGDASGTYHNGGGSCTGIFDNEFESACGADSACDEVHNVNDPCVAGLTCESRGDTCGGSDTCDVNGKCVAPAGCVEGTCSGANVCTGGIWVAHCGDGVANCGEVCDKNLAASCAVGVCETDCSGCVVPCNPNDCSGAVTNPPCTCGSNTANVGDFCCAADPTNTHVYGGQAACQANCGSTCTVAQMTEITGGPGGTCGAADSPCEIASDRSPGIRVRMRSPTEKVYLIDPTGGSHFLGQTPGSSSKTKGDEESDCMIGVWTLKLGGTTCKVNINSTGTCPFCGDGSIDPGETCDTNGDVGCVAPTPVCSAGCGGCVAAAGPGAEICVGGADEDGDGFIDCADPDCAADPACVGACIANGAPCTTNAGCCSGICDTFTGANVCIATSGGAPVCTTGGLIPCGRNCDIIGTSWHEDEPCTLCHLILMGQLIIEFLVKMAAIFAILALVGGGLVYVFSIGSAGTIEKAKTIIKYALLGFTVVFIAWAVIGTILTAMGYMDPLGGEWHMMDC